jgi:catechol 2,3-dioxygenase-like lactoylglutathione lyase family enzyme
MIVTIYATSNADESAARALVDEVLSSSLPAPVTAAVHRVRDAGLADQELPVALLQVMALKGAETFPVTLVNGNPVKSGTLPSLGEIREWAEVGVTEPFVLVSEATSAVEFPGASRIHISLDVANVEASLPFYMVLFGARPTKRREDYIKFELVEPSLNLTLNQHAVLHPSSGHYGIQVKSSRAVREAQERLQRAGFAITEETETACCYAVQTKIWVVDPDGNRWEVFVVTQAEADEGCGPDCICYQELERSFVSGVTAAALTAPLGKTERAS